jgi:hypothetical protein
MKESAKGLTIFWPIIWFFTPFKELWLYSNIDFFGFYDWLFNVCMIKLRIDGYLLFSLKIVQH